MHFEIIPVIDLMGGTVVRAAGGARASYRPLVSPLCPDAAPLSAAKGFMSLFPFATIYLADLDAIEGRDGHGAATATIREAFPDLHLWVDSGLTSADDPRIRAYPGTRAVLGSESLRDLTCLSRTDCVLSLDFRGGRFLGDPRLLDEPGYWPQDIIVMMLDRVGADGGPDFERLSAIVSQAGHRRVYAAGGVRSMADLHMLAGLRVSGALIATALHNGTVDPHDTLPLSLYERAK